ncbi:carbohydrate sulfotransferase 14-like [Eleutherodactylus coqui]|uniref:carbohydrate sulfotransferase 14-like n=1 Tax=Eleutherodactylus coqui TaxID=57060 RepID=UPI003462C3E9
MKFLIRLLILLIMMGIIYLWVKTVMAAGWHQQTMIERTAGVREEPRRTSVTLDTFLHVQQLRKKQLKRFCNRFPQLHSLNTSGSAEHLLSSITVSHKLKTLYCKPEDVTMDGWEELVQAMERRSDVTIRSPLLVEEYTDLNPGELDKNNPTMLARVLRTYTKVLFVGNPYERLVSRYMQGSAGQVSFEEFIEDVLMMEAGEGGVSSGSVIRSCYPCFVQYDYIVMLDFLKAELPHLLRRIGLPESVKLPPSLDLKVISRWLLDNLVRGLNKEQLKQLSQLYSWDFEAFPLRNSLFRNRTNGDSVP